MIYALHFIVDILDIIAASLYFLILSPCFALPGSNVRTSPILLTYVFLPALKPSAEKVLVIMYTRAVILKLLIREMHTEKVFLILWQYFGLKTG